MQLENRSQVLIGTLERSKLAKEPGGGTKRPIFQNSQNGQTKRRQECRRGTQECVRHSLSRRRWRRFRMHGQQHPGEANLLASAGQI
jgi:hypothetical protein